jgi:hypothetical protein
MQGIVSSDEPKSGSNPFLHSIFPPENIHYLL